MRLSWLIVINSVLAAPVAAQSESDRANCQDVTRIPYERILDCTRVLEANAYGPNAMAEMHFWRSAAFRATREWQRAFADAHQATKIVPNDPYYNAMAAGIMREAGDVDAAIRALDLILKGDKRNVAAYFERGEAWMGKRDYERAWADFDAAIVWSGPQRSDPRFLRLYGVPRLLNGRGMASAALRRNEDAIADFDEAIRLDPYLADAVRNRERLRDRRL